MATHQQYKNFVKKYNSEFGFRGYTKLKKQELINKIESVLSKSRKEIKDEYKKLKEMKKEAKPKPTPTPKPTPAPKPKPTPKPAPKATPKKKEKGYKLTKQDIKRLKDWANLNKAKYSSMSNSYKKEILFELKRNDIFKKIQPKTEKEYQKMEDEENDLFDIIFAPMKAIRDKDKPAPKKKPTPKKKPAPKPAPKPKKN